MSNDSDSALRDLDGQQTYTLRPGDENWRAYVGPPAQYDVMGATQFALLTFLGLREGHKLLDFGCGSLRAGRFFIPYLLPGNYYGLEPNKWLIEDAIAKHIGNDQIALKRPQFSHASDFKVDGLGTKFDFIVAQSIFSHTGGDVVATALDSFARNLSDDGLVVATFVHWQKDGVGIDFTGSGWIYPECVSFKPDTVLGFFNRAGLSAVRMAWHHPRQTWYVGAKNPAALARAQALAGNPGFKF